MNEGLGVSGENAAPRSKAFTSRKRERGTTTLASEPTGGSGGTPSSQPINALDRFGLSSEALILGDRTNHSLQGAPEVVSDHGMGVGRVEDTLCNLCGRAGRQQASEFF